MSKFIDQLTQACKSSYYPALAAPFLDYVIQGDPKSLKQAISQKTRYGAYWLDSVWKYLSEPRELTDEEKRAIHAGVQTGCGEDVAVWVKLGVEKNAEAEAEYLAAFCEACGSDEDGRIAAAAALIANGPTIGLGSDGELTCLEQFLLGLNDVEVKKVISSHDEHQRVLKLLLNRDPERVPKIVDSCLNPSSRRGKSVEPRACALLLSHDAKRYEDTVVKAFRKEKNLGPKFHAGAALTAFNADKYREETRSIARELIESGGWDVELPFKWLVDQYGAGALEEIIPFLSSHKHLHYTQRVLRNTIAELGKDSRPAVVAALQNPSPQLRLDALEHLIQCDGESDRELIAEAFERGMEEKETRDLISFLVAGSRWDISRLEEAVWKLLKHKSSPVRQAAARALGRLGDGAALRAVELLEAKKGATRSAAVTVLATVGTPAATKLLEERLVEETDEAIRDQILLALEDAWESQGKKVTTREINARIKRAEDKLEAPVADWLDESSLPPLKYASSGKKLKPVEVRYLLYRQSRAKEMRADVEVKPLLGMIDRKTSGDFAEAVVSMFAAGKMDAKDRWAIALAGLLGDDRLISPLMELIKVWVDSGRGKMAEYAAQAIALLGTDMALCSVDSLSIRYRSKQKNIGKAASEAFAEAAERQGVTVDELGDRVVPWLGFESGKPRLLEYGNRRIEARIGLDFKLSYRDLEKDKAIKSLPAAIPADVKKEFKELGATLREVVKGQLIRLENLMVRQFRWPLARWQELYLNHPVLFPFAVRLIWGAYDKDGRLLATFRALEDRTLTDESDDEFSFSKKHAVVGIVHPLELPAEKRCAWAEHLADYDIQSPILQLERPVIVPGKDDKNTKLSDAYIDVSVNAMTFKGRAERLGWQRGSVCDAGGITCYRKSFPDAGADAIILLDGMYIGVDMYSDITLQQFCFVKGGSVKFGSYEYDEPANDKDDRLIAFGDVPAIVYSEILGNLATIAGGKSKDDQQ